MFPLEPVSIDLLHLGHADQLGSAVLAIGGLALAAGSMLALVLVLCLKPRRRRPDRE